MDLSEADLLDVYFARKAIERAAMLRIVDLPDRAALQARFLDRAAEDRLAHVRLCRACASFKMRARSSVSDRQAIRPEPIVLEALLTKGIPNGEMVDRGCSDIERPSAETIIEIVGTYITNVIHLGVEELAGVYPTPGTSATRVQRLARRLLGAHVDVGYAASVRREAVPTVRTDGRAAEDRAAVGVLDAFERDQGLAKEPLDRAGPNGCSHRGPMRDECLTEEVFASSAEARAVIGRWRLNYNHVRPHSAHGGLTPDAARLNPAAGRLRNSISSAARPLPPALRIGYQNPGFSQ